MKKSSRRKTFIYRGTCSRRGLYGHAFPQSLAVVSTQCNGLPCLEPFGDFNSREAGGGGIDILALQPPVLDDIHITSLRVHVNSFASDRDHVIVASQRNGDGDIRVGQQPSVRRVVDLNNYLTHIPRAASRHRERNLCNL